MQNKFKSVDIENFEKIQACLIPWVKQRFQQDLNFWNHVDQSQLFKDIPELLFAVESIIGQTPSKTYMLAVPDMPEFVLNKKLGPHSIHRDTSTESVRFNWPVLNSTSIETKLFESNAEPTQHVLTSGETYLRYQEQDCTEIASFRMDRPTLLHVHTIHGLYQAPGPLPRYILSFNFENPIEHLLNPI
jgi:hypothetical protein